MTPEQMNIIAEVRARGFVRGVCCKTYNGIRVMVSNRLIDYGDGNILAGGPYPFFIRFKGKWVAEVITKSKTNYVDKASQKRKIYYHA